MSSAGVGYCLLVHSDCFSCVFPVALRVALLHCNTPPKQKMKIPKQNTIKHTQHTYFAHGSYVGFNRLC